MEVSYQGSRGWVRSVTLTSESVIHPDMARRAIQNAATVLRAANNPAGLLEPVVSASQIILTFDLPVKTEQAELLVHILLPKLK